MSDPRIRAAIALALCCLSVVCLTVFGNFGMSLVTGNSLGLEPTPSLAVGGMSCMLLSGFCLTYARKLAKDQSTLAGCLLGSIPAIAVGLYICGIEWAWIQQQTAPVCMGLAALSIAALSEGIRHQRQQSAVHT